MRLTFVQSQVLTLCSQLVLTGAGGAGGGLQHLRGHEVDLGVVHGLDAAFDPQHLPNGVLVPVADFKLFPGLPEVSSHLDTLPTTSEPEKRCVCIIQRNEGSTSPSGHRSGSSTSKWLGLDQFRPACSPCRQIADTCPWRVRQEGPEEAKSKNPFLDHKDTLCANWASNEHCHQQCRCVLSSTACAPGGVKDHE